MNVFIMFILVPKRRPPPLVTAVYRLFFSEPLNAMEHCETTDFPMPPFELVTILLAGNTISYEGESVNRSNGCKPQNV
jgi:hypothetical protein